MMVEVSGSAAIRAGSDDYKSWQLLQNDGQTPIDLTYSTKVSMALRNLQTGVEKTFATDDGSPQLYITDAPHGVVELRPEGFFDAEGQWAFHFTITDSEGDHPVPEGHDEILTVID